MQASAYHPSMVASVKLLASLSSIYLNMSPMSDMARVRAKIPIDMLPILCMFCNGSFWSLYGILVENWFPLLATNVVSVSLSSYFLIVIYTHAGPQRGTAGKKILFALGIVISAIIYAVHGKRMKHPHIATHVGYAGICVSSIMVASPLTSVGTVFKYKSSASLPFKMIAAGTACSFLWFTFGVLIQDMLIIGPNAVNVGIGLLQLSLFVVFPAPPPKVEVDIELVEKKEAS